MDNNCDDICIYYFSDSDCSVDFDEANIDANDPVVFDNLVENMRSVFKKDRLIRHIFNNHMITAVYDYDQNVILFNGKSYRSITKFINEHILQVDCEYEFENWNNPYHDIEFLENEHWVKGSELF